MFSQFFVQIFAIEKNLRKNLRKKRRKFSMDPICCTYGIDSINKVSILCTTNMMMKPELKKMFIFSGRMKNFVTKAAGFIGWRNFVVDP